MTDLAPTEEQTFAMHPDEFKTTLKRLGFTQGSFADYIGSNIRTVNDWCAAVPKNAQKIKGPVRIGPPEYVVRIIQLLDRNFIPAAPASQSKEQAISALSVSFAGLLGSAIAKDWTTTSIMEVLSHTARQHGLHIQRMPASETGSNGRVSAR